MTARCIVPGCGARKNALHHVTYAQAVRREGGDIADPRNLVPLCRSCHDRHHARVAPLPLAVLPDEAFVFARELLGAGPAFVYLARRYAGDDARLDALLENEEAA